MTNFFEVDPEAPFEDGAATLPFDDWGSDQISSQPKSKNVDPDATFDQVAAVFNFDDWGSEQISSQPKPAPSNNEATNVQPEVLDLNYLFNDPPPQKKNDPPPQKKDDPPPHKKTYHNQIIVVIGLNQHGQLGLGHKNAIKELTQIDKSRDFKDIFCGSGSMIYSDFDGNYYAAGYNDFCQLGLGPRKKFGDKLLLEQIMNIKIKKVFMSVSGYGTFFMDENSKIYACGMNEDGNLGTGECIYYQKEPALIEGLEDNILDIKVAGDCSLALCGSFDADIKYGDIITSWNDHKCIINDIIKIIIKFIGIGGCVYSTHSSYHGANGHGGDLRGAGWSKIEKLKDIKISKIAQGGTHSLFVSVSGDIYSCGCNKYGQCGFSKDIKQISIPTKITYFEENNIKISDISSGFGHCLALDINGNIYSFGMNRNGQCGHKIIKDENNDCNIYIPQKIQFFKTHKIISISCGSGHSLAVSEKRDFFLFGGNSDNQCLEENKNKSPVAVNKIISNKYPDKCIQKIICGNYETIFFLSSI